MLTKLAEIPLEFELQVIRKAIAAKTTTVAKKGDWIVEGYAATVDPDLVGDVISAEALKQAQLDLVERSTVLHNHHPDEEVGRVLASKADSKGLWVKVLVSKTAPEVWKKVMEGVLNKFSIRAKIIDAVKKYNSELGQIVNYIRRLKIVEVSLASVPVNAKAAALNVYVQKAVEEFEMDNGKIEQGDAFDDLLDQMEKKGLIPDENGVLHQQIEHTETPVSKGDNDSQGEGDDEQQSSDETSQSTDAAAEKTEDEQAASSETTDESSSGDSQADESASSEEAGEKSDDTTSGDDDASKGEDDEPKSCASYKKEGCPVKQYAKPGEVPDEAKGCKVSKAAACPYQRAAKASKTEKTVANKSSMKDMLRKLLKSAVKQELESALADFRKSIDDLSSKFDEQDVLLGSKMMVIQEKQKSIDDVTTSRKSVVDDETTKNVSDEGDVFNGCLPWDNKPKS